MLPVLFSLGPVSIYTANVFAVIAWFLFAFLFWRYLRAQGMLEERIFDITFYATIVGVLFARLGFVVLFPNLFTGSILLIGAFWVQPGLWLYSGLVGVLVTCYVMAKRFHVRFAHVFDAFVFSLPWTLIVLFLGMFFQGKEVGTVTTVAWAITLSGVEGRRHPIQLYESVALFIIGFLFLLLYKKAAEAKWPLGLSGAVGLTMLTPALFALEFFKSGSLYLYGITVNQWMLIVVFAESIGSVIIKLRHMGVFSKKGNVHDSSTSQPTGVESTRTEVEAEPSGSNQTDGGTQASGSVSEP